MSDHPNSKQALIDHQGGKETRFGAERANPQSQNMVGTNKPWSVRNALKELGRRELDIDDLAGKNENELIAILINKRKMTLPQMGAARALIRFALENKDAQYITENIDGKLVQHNVNADAAALGKMSPEELDEYEQQLDRRIANADGRGGQGTPDQDQRGAVPATRNTGEDAGEAERSDPSTGPTSV